MREAVLGMSQGSSLAASPSGFMRYLGKFLPCDSSQAGTTQAPQIARIVWSLSSPHFTSALKETDLVWRILSAPASQVSLFSWNVGGIRKTEPASRTPSGAGAETGR